MAEWSEIREGLEGLLEHLKEDRLMPRQEALIAGFASELNTVLDELEKLEREIERKGNPPAPAFREAFKRILNRFYSIAVSGPGLAEGIAVKRLNEVWGYGIEAVTSFLERNAKAVGVESWSIAATVGFPSGVSGTVAVEFKV